VRLVNRLRRLTLPVAGGVFLLVALALVSRNLPAILRANSEKLTDFGNLAVASLPPGGGVILGDNAAEVILLKDCLSRQGKSAWVVIDAKALYLPEYRRSVARRAPALWPPGLQGRVLAAADVQKLLNYLVQTNRLYCLQPGFNYFFEGFQLRPQKAIFQIVPSPRPALTAAEVQANEQFWDEAWNRWLHAVSVVCRDAFAEQKTNLLAGRWHAAMRLGHPVSYQSVLVGQWSSATLNSWGVELQRARLLPQAQKRFEQAIALNPDNYAALVNRQCNHALAIGKNLALTNASLLAQELGDPSSLFALVQRYGYIDDPSLCWLMGATYQQNGMEARAIREYTRAREIAPGVPAPGLALMQIYAHQQNHHRVIELAEDLRQHLTGLAVGEKLKVELPLEEAKAWQALGQTAEVRKLLDPLYANPPADRGLNNEVFQAAMAVGDYAPALKLVERQLAAHPGDTDLQINRAAVLIQLGNLPEALAAANRVLAVTNAPLARLNHGIASFQSGDVRTAEADFLQLRALATESFWANYDLGLIAAQRGDTNQAAGYFREARAAVPPGSGFWNKADTGLQNLGRPGRGNPPASSSSK